ncbi:MAG: hypothetical protein P8X82_16485 [Gemmatimonadales bacterium]
MAAGLGVGLDQTPIDRDIEDSFGTGDEREGMHDVLMSRKYVARRAHGAVQIVTGNALGDLDLKHEAKVAVQATTHIGTYRVGEWRLLTRLREDPSDV